MVYFTHIRRCIMNNKKKKKKNGGGMSRQVRNFFENSY